MLCPEPGRVQQQSKSLGIALGIDRVTNEKNCLRKFESLAPNCTYNRNVDFSAIPYQENSAYRLLQFLSIIAGHFESG